MWRIDRAFALAVPLAFIGVGVAAAQATDACPVGQIEIGTLGIGQLNCDNCSIGIYTDSDSGVGRRVWDFRSEPRVGRVVAGSPAARRLQAGDVITTIEGYLITTRAGGIRYGALEPGHPVTLGIRRGGRELEVTLTPVGECVRVNVEHPNEPPAPTAPRPAAAPRADAPPPRVDPTTRIPRPGPPPRPWPSTSALGFSIRCTDCSLQRHNDPERWAWSFSAPPVIERVEPNSPASEAGLAAGDILLRIDGDRLVSAKGGQRFGAVATGDRIALTYRRGSQEHTATLVAREAVGWGAEGGPGPDVQRAPVPTAQPEVTRFSGSLGDAVIQVTGGRVTVTRTDDEIVIRSSDITVRIKRSRER